MSAGDGTTPPAAGCGCQYDAAGQPFTDRCVCPDAVAGPQAGDTGASDSFNAGFARDEIGASEGVENVDLSAGDPAPDDEPQPHRCEYVDMAKRALADRDRLRSEVAALERQRDHLQGQLDIIHDAEYTRNDALQRDNTRLRAEIAAILDEDEDTPSAAIADADRVCRLLAAGNALAARAWRLRGYPQTVTYHDVLRMEAAVNDWRSAAGTPTTDGGEQGSLADRIHAAAIEGVHPARGPLISVAAVLTLLDGHLAAGDELTAVAGALISHVAATGGVPSRASGLWSRLERAAKSWRSQR